MRISGLALASAMVLAATVDLAGAQTPPPAVQPGTEVTIYKVPQYSYLTQGPVATPNTNDSLQANPAFQSSIPGNGIAGFETYPLPGPFELPGAYKY